MAKYKLNDVAPIRQGIVPKSKKYWLLNLDMVESNTGRIIDYLYVESKEIGASTISFDTRNVLYSKLRPYLNKVVLPDRPGYATSEMLPMQPDQTVITREYLTYFLRSPNFVAYINDKTSGAKMPRANSSALKAVEIECPPIKTQRSITGLFDGIATVIKVRKQQLQKLDELVKARFVEMFGDCQHMVSMNELCSMITDGTHQPPKFQDNGIPFIFVSNLVNNAVTYNAEKFISEETYGELYKRTPIEIGDLLLSTVGSYGHVAVVVEDKRFLFQRHIAYLKPKHEIVNSFYLHAALLSPDGQRQIEEKVKGIAQKTLNLSEIKKILIPLPSIEEQKAFEVFVKQTDKSKAVIQKALDEAQLLFDGLMQKYFG